MKSVLRVNQIWKFKPEKSFTIRFKGRNNIHTQIFTMCFEVVRTLLYIIYIQNLTIPMRYEIIKKKQNKSLSDIRVNMTK